MSEQLQVPYRSIPDMFLQRVAATPQADAFAYPTSSGSPAWLTWKQVGDRATAIAAGLHSLGVQPEDRVAIASNTRVDWVVCDLGVMCAGAATTTIYPTTEPKDAAFILSDSGSKVLIAEDATQVSKIADADLPGLTHVVLIDGTEAAAELPDAYRVNPHDLDGLKDALIRALAANPAQSKGRMRAMRRYVRAHDVRAWARTYLKALEQPSR